MTNTTSGKILLVDDEPFNRDMLSRRLQKRGLQVIQAESGKEALALIAGELPELVLLDVMMPDMDGIETLRKIREKHPAQELPVIMVTARDATDDIVEALELGANDYLTKPVDFQIALARIRTQLSLRKATHENALYTKRAELEMKVARTVYRALLPSEFPEMEQFSFGLIFEPCFSIGGDFFEIISYPETSQTGILFADVSGHGVSGAILTAMFKAWVNMAFREHASPKDALRWLNEKISEDFPAGYFVCVFFVMLNDRTGEASYFSASPDVPLLMRNDGTIEEISDGGRPLGLFSMDMDIDDDELFPAGSFTLAPGETLILFTDGLPDIQKKCGSRIGLSGVTDWLKETGLVTPQAITDALFSRAKTLLAGRNQEDDMMIMAIQRRP
ncbi:MAG: hypothetical protein CVV42_18555 [Candidatus Riflebacteria bacterium HGW-Riflebacteria-2]|jgi:two-component system sensor histidine kinase ChiS|nr:MAG: hypothetical protein CVV42_18555 [Candidatus Riflebacteria bacterium HGW-Riflebacteria-2]